MKFIDDESLSPLSEGNLSEDISFWIEQFIEYKEMSKVAKKTIKSYRDALAGFQQFCSVHQDKNSMETMGAKFINRYLIAYQSDLAKMKLETSPLDAQKYSVAISQEAEKFLGKNDAGFTVLEDFENTLIHRTTVLKMFLRFISQNNAQSHDYVPLFHKIAVIRMKEKIMEHITTVEMDEVIDLMSIWMKIYKQHKPKSSERYAYRESLLILLYALTGARSEEVVKIKLKDIVEFEHSGQKYYKVRITEGKGGRAREVAVQRDFIEEHIQYFKKALPSGDYYLSSTSTKDGLYINKYQHQDNVRKFGNYILNLLGINKSGLHTFRRGYATKKIIEDGMNISIVAKMLGNTSAVLEKYYLKHSADFQ